MLFSAEDFEFGDPKDMFEFLPIFIFVALVAPFVMAAYSLGFLMDVTGWLKSG